MTTLTKNLLVTEAAGEGWILALDHEPSTPFVRAIAEPDDAGRFRLAPTTPETT